MTKVLLRMHQVTIHEAKTHLSRLIKEALQGEEIVIAKGKDPLVKLTPVKKPSQRRTIGGNEEFVQYISEDFDESLEDFQEYMK